jgi:predicted metal-dependent peptidase
MPSIKQVALTPQQEKLWSDTRAALIWHCPAFSHIFYSLLQNTGNPKANAVFTDDDSIPIAATDGNNLIFNVGPKGFFRFNLNQRVFIASHEILHCIFNHCGISFMLKMRGKVAYADGKTLPYDGEQMNIAEDYVINAILSEGKVGEFPKDENGQQMGMLDAAIATSKDNSLDTYRKIYKKENSGKKSGGGGGGGPGRFDVHLAPGTSVGQDPVSANNNRNPAQWDTEVAAGVAAAKAMGKMSADVLRALTETLTPKVDWREHIKSLFARKVGSGAFDWARPDRRLITRDIYAPGRSGFGAGCVVVGIDTSGSVGRKELDMFMAEVSGILEEIKPKRLVMIWCDAAVNRVDECEDIGDLNTIRRKGAPGGGGTSFIPVFERVAKEGLEPEALVYLTDGLGTFPRVAPGYPVIWGNIYKGSKYPWGDVVDIPKQDGE